MLWRALLCACALLTGPLQAVAQSGDDGRSFLTAFLEDNLSDLGRTVTITGFTGALSSRATFDQMTIADDTGVWITLTDGAIQWNRTALLSGRIEISEMTAVAIDLPRLPSGGTGSARVAREFSLPDLPVAVALGVLRADRVDIGAAVLGSDVAVTLEGSMQLAGGEGNAALTVTRIDGASGQVTLSAAYANASRQLSLDLLAEEGQDGIAANLLGIPGRPALSLAANGTGPIDDFGADFALSTDGVRRMAGRVALSDEAVGDAVQRTFRADVTGDIAPLLLPDYRAFFGDALTLHAEGARAADGGIELSAFDLESEAMRVSGSASILADGVPALADLTLRLGIDDLTDVLLPLPGVPTTVTGGDLRFGFDASKGDGWTLSGRLSGLAREGFRLATVRLDGSGRIGRAGQHARTADGVGGALSFAAGGIAIADAALARAVGPFLTGKSRFAWQAGSPLEISGLSVTGQGFGATGDGSVGGLDADFALTGNAALRIDDMDRFSAIAGRPLGGSARIAIAGTGSPLTGAFDAEGTVTGDGLTVAQPALDRLLSGSSRVSASVVRDTAGTRIRAVSVEAASLSATASGQLGVGTADLAADLAFRDLSALGPDFRGSLTTTARLTEADGQRRVTASGTADGLRVGQAQIDRVLAGPASLVLDVTEAAGVVSVTSFRLSNPQTTLEATGQSGPDGPSIDFTARLADMGQLAPGFPGPLAFAGKASLGPQAWRIDGTGTGPGATRASLSGSAARDFGTADLTLRGSMQSAILNAFLEPRSIVGPVAFDLRVQGRPAVSSLSGRVTMANGQLAAPAFGLSLTGLNAAADITGGRAVVAADAVVNGGGRVRAAGPIRLTAPYDADLTVTIDRARLRDPSLFETRVSGALTVTGALTGGARIAGSVDLEETEVQVPSSGLDATGFSGRIVHRRDGAAVRETRRRAGLEGADSAQDRAEGAPFGLDVMVNAPNRIFVRGRGLDAEMGGTVRLTGTTSAIVPVGAFDLIRGRLDILGKRLTITEGLVSLQGALTPFIRFLASTESDGITASVLIEGPASEPAISFTSSPDLPEEEVVSRILFGRGLTTISPFQAAQLASAVATLSGRGGLGLVGRLRTSFGLDDLDVTTGEDGTVALRAGKYISANAYTEVSVGSEGSSELSINLDVTRDLTLRGTLGADGQTGLGVFFERDY